MNIIKQIILELADQITIEPQNLKLNGITANDFDTIDNKENESIISFPQYEDKVILISYFSIIFVVSKYIFNNFYKNEPIHY